MRFSAIVSTTTLHGDEAKDYVEAMRDLEVLLETSAEVASLPVLSPIPDSRMDRAYKAGKRDPYEQASILLMSCEDHLRTVLMTTKGNLLPMFALFSLLRPAAEADARMAYLLEPALSEAQRLARGLNVRYESAMEQSKVKLEGVAAHFNAVFARLEQKARGNGIQPVYSKPKKGKPRLIGFGEPVSTDLDLFAKYHGGKELIFRVLSSHVHSRPWYWLDSSKARPTTEPGVSELYVEMDIPRFASILGLVLATHESNLIQLLAHGGYPTSVWLAEKQKQLTRLQPEYDGLLTTVPAVT